MILTLLIFLTACASEPSKLKTIRLNEVVHSIFYAPQYISMEKGFFKEEGLDIVMSVGQGADKSMTALLTDNADIALLGTESGIYVYNEGKANYPIAFAQLTQKAGNYLVSRENEKDFSWENVKGKTIIGGRLGGMPQMVLEYILTKNNITPFVDVNILNNLQYTSTSLAFASDVGDYTIEFDPSAYALEQQGKGFVVASLGTDSGKIPYTVYMATNDYIDKNHDTIQKFTNAIYKGQIFIQNNSSAEIAKIISPHFKETDLASLEVMIDRYKKEDVWKSDPIFDEAGFNLIQDIMEQSGELTKRVPFEKFVNTMFAQQAYDKN